MLAQIGIEIYNGAGTLVATSAPAPAGTAVATVPLPGSGNYRVRVRNYGMTGIVEAPKFIIREPWD